MDGSSQAAAKDRVDRFGNPIDPSVGYARGTILSSSLEESKRREQSVRVIHKRVATHGQNSFFNFTGLHRDYPISSAQIPFAEEWIGPVFFWSDLVARAREHMGGDKTHEVALFNRASAGIVAAGLALSEPGSRVVSISPGGPPHPSIPRGVRLGKAEIVEANSIAELKALLVSQRISLIIVTGVSSELAVIDETLLLEAVRCGKAAGIPVFLDDAYGARLRPIVYGQRKSLETGADIAITSCDKAGLGGPRAGLMVGSADLVARILAQASELGLEARAPLAVGVYASLVHFDPEQLRQEAALGGKIYRARASRYGSERVRKTGLGASITEEDVCDLVYARQHRQDPLPVVPAEITAGIGMYWLEHYGILTVNALGQPGARVSLRFKPDPKEIERFGGLSAVVDAVEDGIDWIAQRAGGVEKMKQLILGAV